MTNASWRAIQGLRATPTGRAVGDRQRRRIFTAALNQAEELAIAASAVTYAVRPLLLFYSLSQAGRAIAAAHLEGRAELSGHGLSFTCEPTAILESTVAPSGTGAFQDVASAAQSSGLREAAELGALWAANPDLQQIPIPEDGRWPRILSCVLGTRGGLPSDGPVSTGGRLRTLVGLPGETRADLNRAIAQYPTLAGTRPFRDGMAGFVPVGPDERVDRIAKADGSLAVAVGREAPPHLTLAEYWGMEDALYSTVEIAETFPRWPQRHLVGFIQPSVGGGPAPSPLMLWWALLLSLSSLARYYPAVWVRTIDLDQSVLASPLHQVLDVAADRVPARVLDALRNHD
jgi:hypothetical protein